MRFIRNIFTIVASAAVMASCDFLDCSETDFYELDEIQESYKQVKPYCINVYGYIPHDFCSIDGAMMDAATDDAIHVYETSNVQRFVNGTWAPNNTIDDVFGKYYNGIHDANYYLENFTNLKFEEWEHSADYDKAVMEYKNYEHEIRFLRAFFYFELVRRYQNIPLIEKVMTQSEINDVKPNTSDEIFDFIIKECDEVAKLLPINYNDFPSKEMGRATRGAALALKARAALYKASPLFNKDNDKKRWEKAAEYAYDIIGNAEELGYKLVFFKELFGAGNHNSKEVIFYRPIGSGNDFESKNFPFGVTNGKTSTCPSENLASTFGMKNGKDFDWHSSTSKRDPYKYRDPRFYETIVHNGMEWPANTPVEIYQGGANAQPNPDATKTGYYLKKYVNNNISFEPGAPTAKAHHNWIIFRYGEVLLNYAEAMINAYGDFNFTNEECGMSAIDAVNAIRMREGVRIGKLSSKLTPEEFLESVKKERRVEMAFEGQRFWDLRRWKELDKNTTIYGINIVKNEEGKLEYGTDNNMEPHEVKKIAFDEKMYFYPFNQKELFKNTNLKQNPGW